MPIPPSSAPLPRVRGRGLPSTVAGALLLLLTACDSGSSEPAAGGGGQQPQATPVTVATVALRDVGVYEDYAGRVRGAREVEVRARVEGVLEERLYDEGGRVAQGEPLFRIDPQPFEVAVQGTLAERDIAAAELRQAEREWTRISRLFQNNAISERERDSARATLELATARLASADARVEQSQLELGYTEVRAPIGGVTSLEVEPEGSLVSRGTLLTRIVQQDPVHVRFALPETDAALQRAALQAMTRGATNGELREALVVLPDGTLHPRSGEIDFTASTIDPQTGTVLARAVFANPDGTLVPGQFVRVRVLLRSLESVAVIPESAVGQGPQGPQVFVVDEDDQARARPVELGPLVEGGRAILAGLEEGDRVVVNGQVTLHDGAPVAPQAAEEAETEAGSGPGEAG